jgi:hypothetical protein
MGRLFSALHAFWRNFQNISWNDGKWPAPWHVSPHKGIVNGNVTSVGNSTRPTSHRISLGKTEPKYWLGIMIRNPNS